MKKIVSAVLGAALLFSQVTLAAVDVTNVPASLSVPETLGPSSTPLGLFKFSLDQTAGETLSSVAVVVSQAASSTMPSSHLAGVSVYRDTGDGVFNPADDLLSGTQSTVNIGTPTLITTSSNNSIGLSASGTPTTFFVSISTGANWSDAAPADAFTVTLPANGITASSGSLATAAVTSPVIAADTSSPSLVSVVAKNTGGTNAKEAADSLDFTFSQPTNKPIFSTTTLASSFILNNGHSLLDASSGFGGVSWSANGTVLTLTLSGTSASGTIASVSVGDTVAVAAGTIVTNLSGNRAIGSAAITGSFSGNAVVGNNQVSNCTNGLINGRLYTVTSYSYVYLSAACRLKLFKGKSLYKAKGNKFQNVIPLSKFPAAGKVLPLFSEKPKQTGLLKIDDVKKSESKAKPAVSNGKGNGKKK